MGLQAIHRAKTRKTTTNTATDTNLELSESKEFSQNAYVFFVRRQYLQTVEFAAEFLHL